MTKKENEKNLDRMTLDKFYIQVCDLIDRPDSDVHFLAVAQDANAVNDRDVACAVVIRADGKNLTEMLNVVLKSIVNNERKRNERLN